MSECSIVALIAGYQTFHDATQSSDSGFTWLDCLHWLLRNDICHLDVNHHTVTFRATALYVAAVNQLGIAVTGYYGDLGSGEDMWKVPSSGVGHLVQENGGSCMEPFSRCLKGDDTNYIPPERENDKLKRFPAGN